MFSKNCLSKIFLALAFLLLTEKKFLFSNNTFEQDLKKQVTLESSAEKAKEESDKKTIDQKKENNIVANRKSSNFVNAFKNGIDKISKKVSSSATKMSDKILNKIEKDAKNFVVKAKEPIHLYDLLLKNKGTQNNEELFSYGSTFFITTILLMGVFKIRGDKAFCFSQATEIHAGMPKRLLSQKFNSPFIAISSILIPMGVFGLFKLGYQYSRIKMLILIKEAFLSNKLVYPKNATSLLKSLSEVFDPQLSEKNWKFFKFAMKKSRFFYSMLSQACEVGFKEEELANAVEVVEKVTI